jgi:hypothetical protein
VAGCRGCAGNLPAIVAERTHIQVKVPAEPRPRSLTRVLVNDVTDGRDVFLQLYRTTNRTGRCSPMEVESKHAAHEVMTVSYAHDGAQDQVTLYLLARSDGTWVTAGYGGVELFDHPQGFPAYRYSDDALARVKAWYEQHVPPDQRQR